MSLWHIFGGEEVLEEATSYWEGSAVVPLAPKVYRKIVSELDSSTRKFYYRGLSSQVDPRVDPNDPDSLNIFDDFGSKGSVWDRQRYEIDLDDLADPANFQRLIPELGGYGMMLIDRIRARVPEKRWRQSPGHVEFGSVGGGSITHSGTYSWKETGNMISVIERRILQVEVVKSQQGDDPYDLLYSFHSQEEGNFLVIKDSPRFDGIVFLRAGYLTPPVRILSADLPGGLVRAVGKEVLREG